MTGSALEYLNSGAVFDVRRTPSTMGAVTEHFRRSHNVVRSIHPTHSVAALGPGAEAFVAGHESASTPFGDGTPFARLLQRQAKQVWFGCGIGPFTVYHLFECLRDPPFPLPVFLPEPNRACYIDAHGRHGVMDTLVHDPKLAAVRVDARPDVEQTVRMELERQAVLQTTTLGRGEIITADLSSLMLALEEMLTRGTTIYNVSIDR